MNNQQYNPSIKLLLSKMLTVADLRTQLNYIRDIEMNLFNVHIDLKEQLIQILPYEIKELYVAAMHESGINIQDARLVQLFLGDLKNKLSSIPVMGIIMSYPPTEKELRNFSSFIFTNIGAQVVFDIKLDQNLIGGCRLEFGGRIADYSVAKMLESYMESKIGGQI